MANASSRARAVYNQNTAVLYYEPSENVDDAPVSTARVVPVGVTSAARSGATLQLVGGLLEDGSARHEHHEQPKVIEVEPPRAAARKRPVGKQPTCVIAYNVRIVASDDAQLADEARPYVEVEAVQGRTLRGGQHAGFEAPPRIDEQFDIRGRSHRHPEMQLDMQPGAVMHAQPVPQNIQFETAAAHAPLPNGVPGELRERRPIEMPENVPPGFRSPRGQIPMSLFGALESMGGRLHERTRHAAGLAQAATAAGSYKELIAQHWTAVDGPLLSNRNLCIAVGAYALILFLLAFFG